MNNKKKPTILIVDDHDSLRDSLKRWLSTAFDTSNQNEIAKSLE